jgi:hypothetical protein
VDGVSANDAVKGHFYQNFQELLGTWADQKVPRMVQYLVACFEACKPWKDEPGRLHEHVYVEYKTKVRGRQVFRYFL